MTNGNLARSYLEKARLRLEVLALLMERKGYSDVVREAQELVELALKGMLREVGIEPPKYHDVGGFLLEHATRFAPEVREHLPALAELSTRLRKDRELSFYGDTDFIPSEQYSEKEAAQAIDDATLAVKMATRVISRLEG